MTMTMPRMCSGVTSCSRRRSALLSKTTASAAHLLLVLAYLFCSVAPQQGVDAAADEAERKLGMLWKGGYPAEATRPYKQKLAGDLISICHLEPHPQFIALYPAKAKKIPTDGVCIAGEKVMNGVNGAPPRRVNEPEELVCGDRCERWCSIVQGVPAAACLRPSAKDECKEGGFCCVCANPDQSGWFVGLDAEGRPDYEDCNEACARYTTVIQDAGFPGTLVCNDRSIEKMSNVLTEPQMKAALKSKSEFSDDFPISDAIQSIAEDNRGFVGSISPYFFSIPAMSMNGEARFVPDLRNRAHAQCDNAFTTANPQVNRYCFCDYVV